MDAPIAAPRPPFDALVASGTPVLGDCSTGTRLRLQSPLPSDPDLGLVPTVEHPLGPAAVQAIAGSYAATAGAFGLPILIDAPTWWARTDRLERAGRDPSEIDAVMARCIAAVLPLRAHPGVHLGAMIGPSTDGYQGDRVDRGAATSYHHRHVEAVVANPVDVVLAATFSTADDLGAAASALADSALPYVLGPVVDADGNLPDGTPLADAIDQIESDVRRAPSHWAICCTHPRVAAAALERTGSRSAAAHARVRQVKGNGSEAAAAERDAAQRVLCDEPEPWAEATLRLHDDHGVNVLGGCCGTDDRHLLSVAIRLADRAGATPVGPVR